MLRYLNFVKYLCSLACLDNFDVIDLGQSIQKVSRNTSFYFLDVAVGLEVIVTLRIHLQASSMQNFMLDGSTTVNCFHVAWQRNPYSYFWLSCWFMTSS